METPKLTAALYGLRKFTNYSIQVLAYTRRGEGVRSPAIYVSTQPDSTYLHLLYTYTILYIPSFYTA